MNFSRFKGFMHQWHFYTASILMSCFILAAGAQAQTSQANQISEASTSNTATQTDSVAPAGSPGFASFEQAMQGLQTENFNDKQKAVYALPTFDHPQTQAILSALLDGQLYEEGGQFFIKKADGDAYQPALDPAQANATPADPKKIAINNNIRQWLKNYLAENALKSPDANSRLNAMKQIMDKADEQTLAQVKAALPTETDGQVKTLMNVYIAKADLASGDATAQANAIAVLAQAADASSRGALQSFMDSTSDAQLKSSAQAAIQKIDQKISMIKNAETLTFGLSMGSVLVLAAIGLAITFGVMGVINMAHGELIMIGAYCAYVVQLLMPQYIEWSILVAIPVAFIVSGLVGILIERTVVRFLYGRPLETLLATFGVSLILQQAVRSAFSPLNRMVQTPSWMSGSLELASGLSITWNRVYIIMFCLLCFLALLAIMKKTRLGLEVNAVSQNRDMARAMGISDKKVDMLTFGLGSGVAGVAGVALSQITNVGPNLGQSYIIDSFMVVVVGGVGSLWGTLLAGLGLGVLNKAFEPWMGAVLAKAIVLVLVILFIQKFPRGIFPQKGRAVE